MKTIPSEKVRHLVLQGTRGEALPDALVAAFREEGVARAWLRGGGVISDVVLRTLGETAGSPDVLRRINGPVQLLLLEGSLGILPDAPLSLRAVLARETDRGMDTLAGEIVAARIVSFEAVATALDGAAEVHTDSPSPQPPAARGDVEPPPQAVPAATWSDAIAASSASSHVPAPIRPVRRQNDDLDTVFPEAGDLVDHFAFGRCEVLKSDGDRLHLRVGKDGRIREIALEMLRVQPLPDEGDKRRFRLERKL
jgi:predicted DNA-binding protein with PD1-like motif